MLSVCFMTLMHLFSFWVCILSHIQMYSTIIFYYNILLGLKLSSGKFMNMGKNRDKAHQPRKKMFLLWQQGLWAGYVFSEVTKLELVNINSWVLSVWKRCWNLTWRVSICGSIPWRDWDSTSDPQVALAGKTICPFVCLILLWVMKSVAKQIREAGRIAAWMSF